MLLYQCILLSQFGSNCSTNKKWFKCRRLSRRVKKAGTKMVKRQELDPQLCCSFSKRSGVEFTKFENIPFQFLHAFSVEACWFLSARATEWYFSPLSIRFTFGRPRYFFSVVYYIVTFDAKNVSYRKDTEPLISCFHVLTSNTSFHYNSVRDLCNVTLYLGNLHCASGTGQWSTQLYLMEKTQCLQQLYPSNLDNSFWIKLTSFLCVCQIIKMLVMQLKCLILTNQ